MDLKTFLYDWEHRRNKIRRDELLIFVKLLLEERNAMFKRFQAAKRKRLAKKKKGKKE